VLHTSTSRWLGLSFACLVVTLAAAQQPAGPAAGGGAPGGRAGGQGARAGGPGFPRPRPGSALTAPREFQTLVTLLRVVPLVNNLAAPWSLAFLPNGDMLVTEKVGRLRLVRNGVLDPTPISGVPAVLNQGQGGLLEVSLHPRFQENRLVYLTYSKDGGERGNTTALARGVLDGSSLRDVQDIFVADAWANSGAHFGSRLAWGRDGTLFMTVGERNDRNRAQDTTNHAGKVLRLRDDGSVPPDNPFVGRAGFRPEIYSYGHRSLQGLTLHPETGQLWETEHGPQGGDELNLIQPGKNYGWPIATFGREYTGEVITNQPFKDGLEPPVTHWVPSIGLSGMLFYTGDRIPAWKGSLFVGGLSGLQLQRVGFSPGGPIGRESLLVELQQRIRDIRQGQDGFIYVLTDANPTGAILRLEPGTASPSSN
jgi:glucose/arabinose dehydrogenase